MTKQEIIDKFSKIMCSQPGICGFISEQHGQQRLFDKLLDMGNTPISLTQLNQLLSMHQIPQMTKDVFLFYFFDNPDHYYKTKKHEDYTSSKRHMIKSIEQLYIGIERIFIDALFVFGNINKGYDAISKYSYEELCLMAKTQRINEDRLDDREDLMEFQSIERDDRYLISEMACKTLGDGSIDEDEMAERLEKEYKCAIAEGKVNIKFKDLVAGIYSDKVSKKAEQMTLFDSIDFYEEPIIDINMVRTKARDLARRYTAARRSAMENTKLYLSMAKDLDAYIATSMRTKEDFLMMSAFCDNVFHNDKLIPLHLRYFDPTLSATSSHEDKGLIECLMVKQAKMLIYSSGEKDSYGKDAEAAMALCLGKPVIIYSPIAKRFGFFRNVHPLSRLVCFNTGVANGAIVCESEEQVVEMVFRIMNNKMEYELEQKKERSGYYLLKERITGSVVRIQTNESYLNSVFWENYLA